MASCPPPVALGVGAASLSDKFAAITHAFRIESSSWRDVAKLFSRFLSVTTDYCTEVGLQQVPPLDISTVHPFWQDDDDKDDAIVDDVADGVDAKETRLQQPLSMRSAMPVPGSMHVLHNALSDLGEALPDYEEWARRAKALARYVSERHTKDRLIATCFGIGTEGAKYRPEIESFNQVIYDKRFDTLVAFIEAVLPLRVALTTRFDVRQLRSGNEQVGSVLVKDVAAAVFSTWWWGFCHVLQRAGVGIYILGCVLRGCSCHPASAFDLQGSDNYMKRRRAYERERLGWQQSLVPCEVATHIFWQPAVGWTLLRRRCIPAQGTFCMTF